MIDVQANEANIIVTTSPGAAQLIARVLDYHKNQLNILGTIAGDDTIFIAPKHTTKMAESVKLIKDVLF